MRQDVKTKWLEYLRSDKYKQGRLVLRQPLNNTYCCLGVLCEAARDCGLEATDDELFMSDGENLQMFTHQVMEFTDFNPSDYGFNVIDGNWKLDPINPREHLWGLNDAICLNFSQIADLIEEYVPGE